MNSSDDTKNTRFDQRIKDAMDQLEVKPSDKVWVALEQEISKGSFKRNRFGSNSNLLWALGILGLAGTFVYFLNTSTDLQKVIIKQQPAPGSTKVAAPSGLDLNISSNKASTNKDFIPISFYKKESIRLMPLKTAPDLQIRIPAINLEPKATENALLPSNSEEGKMDRKIEKRKEKKDDFDLEYKDEQHDINNNALYNNGIKENTDVRENNIHGNHK